MGGKNKSAGSQKQPRTKGNVKPSSSEKAASFLVQKTGSLGIPGGGGGGFFSVASTASISFGGKLAAYVPLDHDPDAIHIDADIRMQLRKLDKRDAVTKQKALLDLITLLQSSSAEDGNPPDQATDQPQTIEVVAKTEDNEKTSSKSDADVLGALPYWPRIYARLSMDEDRKVRELSQRTLLGFTKRAGKNIAPYLKQLLPPWVMSQCDLYEPAALEAERAFQSTFPAHKQKDAYLHCWSEIFSYIEETMGTENPPPTNAVSGGSEDLSETAESKYARTIVACLRTFAKLLTFIGPSGKPEMTERISCALKDKQFWRHTKSNLAVINAAYYLLITQVCHVYPQVAHDCCVQFCELTLRHVDQDSPVVVSSLWEALLSVLNHVSDVWRFVSFKKSFQPKLVKVLEDGGSGSARYIFPNMLPLFSKLPLGTTSPDDVKVLLMLLKKMYEGLHKERVYVSSLDSNAVVNSLMECCRYLISEALKQGVPDVAREIIQDVVLKLLLESLQVPRSRNFADSVFLQASQLLIYLDKTYSALHLVMVDAIKGWIPSFGSDRHFNATIVSFILLLTESSSDLSSKAAIKKSVSFTKQGEIGDSFMIDSVSSTCLSVETDSWKIQFLGDIQVLLEKLIVDNNPQCLMPYFCITSKLPNQATKTDASRVVHQTTVLRNCPPLFVEENMNTLKVCRIIGLGIAGILNQITDPGSEIANLFQSLSGNQAVLFLGKGFPWIVQSYASDKSHQVQEAILMSLESEIVKWSKLMIEEVFIKYNTEFEDRLQTLLHILFANKLSSGKGHFDSLMRIRGVIIDNIVACFKDKFSNSDKVSFQMSKDVRHFLAENLYSFICLQEYDSRNLSAWLPLVHELSGLYMSYLSLDAKSFDPNTADAHDSDDSLYIYTKIESLIFEVYECLLKADSDEFDEMLADFTGLFWSLVFTAVTECKRKEGLDEVRNFCVRLLDMCLKLQIDNCQRIVQSVLQRCFDCIDNLLVLLADKVFTNQNYFHAILYHTNQEEFASLLHMLYYCLPFVESSKYGIDQAAPDYWLSFLVAVSLADGSVLHVDTWGISSILESLRTYALNNICSFKVKKSSTVLCSLLQLCHGNFEFISKRRFATVTSLPALRLSLLYCIPTQPSMWPTILGQYVDNMLSEWSTCSIHEFETIRDVLIPASVRGRNLVKESVMMSLTTVVNQETIANLSEDLLNRYLSLLCSLVQVDSSYLLLVMPLLIELKDNNNYLIDEADCSSTSFDDLKPTLWTLWIMFKGIQNSPADITPIQLDFILCLTATHTSVVVSDLKETYVDNIEHAAWVYHVLCLIYAIGTALPCLQMENVLNEWNDFFSVHIYGSLLPLFIDLTQQSGNTPSFSSASTGFVFESLGSAISVCPVERLLKHTLPPKLFADDPVLLPSIELQTLVNTLFPLLYHPRQSVQLAALHNLLSVAGELGQSLTNNNPDNDAEEDTQSNDNEAPFKVPLTLTRNLYADAPGVLIKQICTSANFGSVSPLIKASISKGNHTTLVGYLLTWRVVLAVFEASTLEIRGKFAGWLLGNCPVITRSGAISCRPSREIFGQLMDLLFRTMPGNPICSLKAGGNADGGWANISNITQPRSSITSLNLTEEEPRMYDTVSDHRSSFQAQHLACNIYLRVLQDAPALARTWWLRQNKVVASTVDRYTERFVSPFLCREQIEEVNKVASSTTPAGPFPEDNVLEIKGRPAARDVVVSYRMQDSHAIEMLVTLPVNYPLGQVTVESGKKVGVTTQQWRSWLLQLTIFLQNQNGSILEGILLWKRNLDKRFEGVEECTICYSILHGTTFQLPTMKCRVCHKRFHRDCMYKWFSTSGNPTCPLCRNLFYHIPHSSGRQDTDFGE